MLAGSATSYRTAIDEADILNILNLLGQHVTEGLDEVGPWLIQQKRNLDPTSALTLAQILQKVLSEPMISKISPLGLAAIYKTAMDTEDTTTIEVLAKKQASLPHNEELDNLVPWLIINRAKGSSLGYTCNNILRELFSEKGIFFKISSLGLAKIYRAAMEVDDRTALSQLLDMQVSLPYNEAISELEPWLIKQKKLNRVYSLQYVYFLAKLNTLSFPENSERKDAKSELIDQPRQGELEREDEPGLPLDHTSIDDAGLPTEPELIVEPGLPPELTSINQAGLLPELKPIVEPGLSEEKYAGPLLEQFKGSNQSYSDAMNKNDPLSLKTLLNKQATLPGSEELDQLGPWLLIQKGGEYRKLLTKLLSDSIISKVSPLGLASIYNAAMKVENTHVLHKLLSKQAKLPANEGLKVLGPWLIQQMKHYPHIPDYANLNDLLKSLPPSLPTDTLRPKKHHDDGFFKGMGRTIKSGIFAGANLLINPATLLATTATAISFATGVAAPFAFVIFTATFAVVKTFQTTRRRLAKRAYNKLTIDNDRDPFLRNAFNEGMEAQKSWSAYMSSSYLTYFGTLNNFGQAYQAGRHAQVYKEARENHDLTKNSRRSNKP